MFSGLIHMNIKPRVSVLMPVYNGEKYLRGAIDSILGKPIVIMNLLL